MSRGDLAISRWLIAAGNEHKHIIEALKTRPKTLHVTKGSNQMFDFEEIEKSESSMQEMGLASPMHDAEALPPQAPPQASAAPARTPAPPPAPAAEVSLVLESNPFQSSPATCTAPLARTAPMWTEEKGEPLPSPVGATAAQQFSIGTLPSVTMPMTEIDLLHSLGPLLPNDGMKYPH